jgi:hypothetical protein
VVVEVVVRGGCLMDVSWVLDLACASSSACLDCCPVRAVWGLSSSASASPQHSLARIPAAGNLRSLIDQFALNAQSLLPRHFAIVCSLSLVRRAIIARSQQLLQSHLLVSY